ncbi:LysE family transporter [Tsukamurella sp. 8F]|uniref:LysE family transporter n=1 Tax=unclassified Tsukamurella TaxID=2633480 RepID=UPI0023B8F1FA|nr:MULTISPECIES: LysE family transporter [unclassified Tsukamurella]MDF0531103.1 LysE family transporter [Tsukamurella sp. 8J]MDF0588349.1 LysE family transporter [Tsukamurella sp. 8F]
MTHTLLSGYVAGFALAMPLGPFAILLIGIAARSSIRVALWGALGAALADAVYATVAVFAGAAAARIIAPVESELRIAAGVILIGMALYIASSALRQDKGDTPQRAITLTPIRVFLTLFTLTLVNPWPLVYFTALVLGGGIGTGSVIFNLGYVIAVLLGSLTWQALIASAGGLVGRRILAGAGRTVSSLLSAALIIALSIFMMVG